MPSSVLSPTLQLRSLLVKICTSKGVPLTPVRAYCQTSGLRMCIWSQNFKPSVFNRVDWSYGIINVCYSGIAGHLHFTLLNSNHMACMSSFCAKELCSISACIYLSKFIFFSYLAILIRKKHNEKLGQRKESITSARDCSFNFNRFTCVYVCVSMHVLMVIRLLTQLCHGIDVWNITGSRDWPHLLVLQIAPVLQ